MSTTLNAPRKRAKKRRSDRTPTAEAVEQQVTTENQPQVSLIALADIERDAENHRLGAPASRQKIQELAESLRINGQQQPVQVYAYPEGQTSAAGHRYLLAFGFRRCTAAELCEWSSISAIIKPMPLLADGSIDRLTIQRIRGIENLQRENLNPIEECVLIEQLAANLPAEIDGAAVRESDGRLTDVASRFLARSIGRTEAWVRDRLYLTRLSPAVKQKVIDGKLFLLFAREIAKLADHGEQERLAGLCEADADDGHCHTTIAQVRRYVGERQNSLRGVPWHLDKEFPKHRLIVGACATCPFNSTNDKNLFEHDGAPAPEGFCLRSSCFEAKRAMTDKAVDAAVEKIVTQKKPATETSAVELAAEFVKPGRVARQAKKRLEPAPSQSPEKAKTEYWETPEYKAKLALTEAERKWRENVSDSLTESLRRQPGRLASLVMLVLAGKLQRQMSTKELSRAEEAIKLTVKPTWQNLLQLEKRALARKQFDIANIVSLHSTDVVAKALAESYSLSLPPFPKLEDFMPKPAMERNASGNSTDNQSKGDADSTA